MHRFLKSAALALAVFALAGCDTLSNVQPSTSTVTIPVPLPTWDQSQAADACTKADVLVKVLTVAATLDSTFGIKLRAVKTYVDFVVQKCDGPAPPTLADVLDPTFTAAVDAINTALVGVKLP